MNVTLFGLVLRNLSLQSPLLIRPLAGADSSLSIRASNLARFTNAFLFSRQNIIVRQSSFHFFLQRPFAVDGADTFTGKIYHKQLSEIGEKTVVFTECLFSKCNENHEKGGALFTYQCKAFLDRCSFSTNSAKFGGSVFIADATIIEVNNSLITLSRAERFGAGYLDGHEPANNLYVNHCNITQNHADKWIGGLRLQHNGGRLQFCNFVANTARVYGAVWDYGHKPATREFSHCRFTNNTAIEAGAGITGFHILYRGSASRCIFSGNANANDQNGRSVFLFADNSVFIISECEFDGPAHKELMGYHPDSRFIESQNKFNQNPAEIN